MPKAMDISLETREVVHKKGFFLGGVFHATGKIIEVPAEMVDDLVKRGILADKAVKTRKQTVRGKASGNTRRRQTKASAKKAAKKREVKKVPNTPPPEISDPEPKKPEPKPTIQKTLDLTREQRLAEDVTASVMPTKSPNRETESLSMAPEPRGGEASTDDMLPPMMESRGGAETRVIEPNKGAAEQKKAADKKKASESKKGD